MTASLNALFMLVILAGTAVACATMRRERPRIGRVAIALGAGGALFLAGLLLFVHMCDKGAPVTQLLVCAACLTSIWLCLASRAVRWAGTVALVAACFALCAQFNAIVHRDDYTGNPACRPVIADARPHALWHTRLTGIHALRPR
jgi:hypothetical protein